MALDYSMKRNNETLARAKGANLPISLKYSIEICNYIRGDKIARATQKLKAAIAEEIAVPFKRFTDGVGHRKGADIVSGRFAVKACTNILKLLNSAKSNAVFKGLNVDNLVLVHVAANQAPQAWHHGRQRRQSVKKCHVEIVLEESVEEAKKTKKTEKPKTVTEESVKAEEVVVVESKEEEVKPETKVETNNTEGVSETKAKEEVKEVTETKKEEVALEDSSDENKQ